MPLGSILTERDAGKSLTEDQLRREIRERKDEWERTRRHFDKVLPFGYLTEHRSTLEQISMQKDLMAFLVASAVQNGEDVAYWAETNRDNSMAAEVLLEIFFLPQDRPPIRAAFAIQFLEDNLRRRVIEHVRNSFSDGFERRLIEAVAAGRVVDFIEKDTQYHLSNTRRAQLLEEFRSGIRIRF